MSLNARERRRVTRAESRHEAPASPSRQAERCDARKCHPNRQWRPEGRLVNCCLPHRLRTIEDFFSPARMRVIEAMTIKAPPGGATRMPDDSWRITISQAFAAERAGVCLRTARNAIKQAIDN